jgi:type III secretion protein T
MPDVATIEAALMGFALGLPRMLIAFSLLPIFNKQNSATFIRTGIAMAFLIPVAPMLIQQVQVAPVEVGWIIPLMLKEAAVGFLLGFIFAIPFWAAEALGFVIDNQRGATTADMTNFMTGNQASPLAILMNQAYGLLFLLLGGIPIVLNVVYESYAIWPVLAPMPGVAPELATYYIGLVDALVRSAIVLAAPAMISMLLAELALAVVSLFAPQLQVFFLAMPIKSGVALFVLVLYLPTLFHYLGYSVVNLRQTLDILIRMMG